MKFLKALFNSLLCGLFFCLLLALLFAGLNVNARLPLDFLGRLALLLFVTYGLAVALVSLAIFFIFDFFSSKKNAIAIISPTFLAVGFSLLTFLFQIIFWQNYRHFRSFFDSVVQTHLLAQMKIFLAMGVLGLLVTILFYRWKKSPLLFGGYALLFLAGLAFVVSERPPASLLQPPAKQANLEAPRITTKLTLLGMEGLSFDFIIPLLSEGKLPNFSLLVEQGSWGRLSGFTPNDLYVLSASLDTGKLPAKHRQLSSFTYQLDNFKEQMDVVPRYIFFNQLSRTGLLKLSRAEPAGRPTDLWQIFAQCGLTVLKRDLPLPGQKPEPGHRAETSFGLLFKDLQSESSIIFAPARQAFSQDFLYEEEAYREKLQAQPHIFSLMLTGLNMVESHFYQYSFPDLYSGVDSDEAAKYGTVIEKYYQFYDQIVGRYLASLKEDETLIIYSPHGIEPLPFLKRLLGWVSGSTGVSADHDAAPEGVIFFYGKNIARAKNIEGMRVIDLAPTLLYSLGLPVGKDMDGIVRSQVFIKDFTAENPIFFISSYEDIRIKPAL
jgi:Type I phosphodiesterase / nucleotide pyrophosphatase